MRKAAINLTLAIQGLQNLGEVFGIPDVVHPQMKTKQIPDDFRDWIEAQTFEIVARVAWPPRLP